MREPFGLASRSRASTSGADGGQPAPAGARDRILTLIALFKFLKAMLLVAIGLGTLGLLRPGVADVAEQVVSGLSSSLARNAVQRVLAHLTQLGHKRLQALGVGAFVYAAVFTVEGIGLWRGRRWAEYLTVIVTISFVPFELYELVSEATVPRASALLLNLAVVAYLLSRLRDWRRTHHASEARGT